METGFACAEPEAIEKKLKELTLDILFDTEQLFMKDLEQPIHSMREIYHFKGDSRSLIGLGPNEFIDKTDSIGLFSQHPEPYEFLSVKQIEKYSESPGIYGIEIVLSNKLHEYERTRFTVMALLGELGGAFSIISALPPLFIASIVEKFFANRVAKLMPYKQEEQVDQGKRNRISLRNKLRKPEVGEITPKNLNAPDVQSLLDEALKFKKLSPISELKLLWSRCARNHRNEQIAMQEQFYEAFESKLDVWNLAQD